MNNISAIATAGFGLGSILGPILASFIQEYSDFRWSFTVGGCIILLAGLLKTYSMQHTID
jgi:MFS family permease